MKRTSAEIKRMARESLNGSWGIMIGTYILVALIIYVVELPILYLTQLINFSVLILVGMIASFVISMVAYVLQMGVINMHLKLARKQEVSVGMMFSQFTNRPYRFILASILLGLISIICMAPGYVCMMVGVFYRRDIFGLTGSLLLIVGSVICVILNFMFMLTSYFLIDDSQIGVIAAFKASARQMQGNKGRAFYISLSFIGWIFLGMFSCGIGMLWVMPYMAQTMVQFYLDVKGEADHRTEQKEEAYIFE